MENSRTATAVRRDEFDPLNGYRHADDNLSLERLNSMLAAHAEKERRDATFDEQSDEPNAPSKKLIADRQAFAYFGLLLGIFPPAAIFTQLLVKDGSVYNDDLWLIGVFAVVNLISAIVGYFSGRRIGELVGKLENASWTKMLVLLPFIGTLWGIIAGGAGGVIVFAVGAIVGAMFGAAVGAVALPLFAIFHRLLKHEDAIEQRYFLPLALGITFTICAFILGL